MGDAQDARAQQVQRLLAYDGIRSIAMSPRMRMSGREQMRIDRFVPVGPRSANRFARFARVHEPIWNQLLGFVGFGFSVLGTHTHAQPEETHIH